MTTTSASHYAHCPQCSEAWLRSGGFCSASCGQCASSTACNDNQPAGGFTCAQQAAWGKVRRQHGCGLVQRSGSAQRLATLCVHRVACTAPALTTHSVHYPPPSHPQCSEPWVSAGNYCAASCGRCSAGVDAGGRAVQSVARQRTPGLAGPARATKQAARCRLMGAPGVASLVRLAFLPSAAVAGVEAVVDEAAEPPCGEAPSRWHATCEQR